MRSLLSSSAVLAVLFAAPATALAGGSVGRTSLSGSTHIAHAGRAMAFRSRAASSGRINRLRVYLARRSSVRRLQLALYRNRAGRPSSRLAHCAVTRTRARAWNACAVRRIKVRARTRYWVALLQPRSTRGRLRFRMRRAGRSAAIRSRAGIKRLPRAWSRARTVRRKGRASLFADLKGSSSPTSGGTRPPSPDANLPPLGKPSCVSGATAATTAAQVRSAVEFGSDVCVRAAVGDVNLDNLSSSTVRTIGTDAAGSMGEISLARSSRITLRARFRSIQISDSNSITIEQSRLGGTSADRTLDNLIQVSSKSDDVVIRDNEIAWTSADSSGNTGYGIRAFHGDRMQIVRNSFHNIGADAMQLGMDSDLLIDRNEVAYTSRPAASDEHSDDLQLIGNGPNTRITNNYFHHCGWLSPTGPTTGCNSEALHAGSTASLLFENNVEMHALGLPFVGDLGTGGTSRSNSTWRNNTWWDNGTQFADGPDLQFGLKSGTNNRWERNLVVSQLNFSDGAGFAQSGTAATDNLVGAYAMSADGQCIAAACTTSAGLPIGYRKPAGVHW
jgi:Right handed beta helix region